MGFLDCSVIIALFTGNATPICAKNEKNSKEKQERQKRLPNKDNTELKIEI